jgi:uncharacterized tellurite resistance protein B-like protein
MSEQLFSFLQTLDTADRAEYFAGRVKVYELCFPFADAGGTVHSQEFQTILAINAVYARCIGKMIAENLGYKSSGWNGHVQVTKVG